MTQPPPKPPEPNAPDSQSDSEFSERLAFIGGFLWFHRRVWIGGIILLSIAIWIYLINQDRDTSADSQSSSVANAEVQPNNSANSALANRDTDNRELIGLQQTSSLEQLLRSGSKSDLIAYCLNIENQWRLVTPTATVVMMQDRLKVLDKLLAMDLNEDERNYAITTYIESVSIQDSYNVQGRMGIEGTREKLLEVESKYFDHPSPAVVARANLALMMIPAYEFVTDNDADRLEQFAENFQKHHQEVFQDIKTTSQLVEVTMGIMRSKKHHVRAMEVAGQILAAMDSHPDSKINEMAEPFAERLYFGELDLLMLAYRAGNEDDADTREDVQTLFDGLRAWPQARNEFYIVAGECIKSYQKQNKLDRAGELIDQLQNARNKITDSKKKGDISRMIQQLKSGL